ncbi:MAG: SDR family NAD(P)-dependent oxidoreductase [Nocardia sp.]|nr:SDR family NAD(P)-dependent oxidoreductase [Nocardia sp.]
MVNENSARPVAVVTGSSSGIGRATAIGLVGLGWRVIGVGRDPRRSAEAVEAIGAAAREGGEITMLRADFTSMAQVRGIAEQIREHTDRLDVLINNAGGVRDRLIITDEGTEATFAANHLAPFLLTRELLPLLTATAATRPPGTVRVLAVSSSAHRVTQGLNWDDLQSVASFRPAGAYCQAKLANILFTRELARRVAGRGIVAQAMHPGIVDTRFGQDGDVQMRAHMAAADTVSPDEPADTLLWLATAAEAAHTPGRYFYRRAEEQPSDAARDDAAAARLWSESEKILADLGH